MGKTASRTARRIALVRARDGETCCYCGHPIRFYAAETDRHRPTIEHVLSRSQGGSNDPRNLKLAHSKCNNRVGNAPFFEKVMLMRWAGHTTAAKPRWAA